MHEVDQWPFRSQERYHFASAVVVLDALADTCSVPFHDAMSHSASNVFGIAGAARQTKGDAKKAANK